MVCVMHESHHVITSRWKLVAGLLNQMVKRTRVMLGFTSIDMEKLWNIPARTWWFPRDPSYHTTPQTRLLHRCMSKKPLVVLQLSNGHCLCGLDCIGQHCDGDGFQRGRSARVGCRQHISWVLEWWSSCLKTLGGTNFSFITRRLIHRVCLDSFKLDTILLEIQWCSSCITLVLNINLSISCPFLHLETKMDELKEEISQEVLQNWHW